MTEDRGDYTRRPWRLPFCRRPPVVDCGRSPYISVKCAVSVEAVYAIEEWDTPVVLDASTQERRKRMKTVLGLLVAGSIVSGAAAWQAAVPDTVEGHVAAARAAAGEDFTALADRLCEAPAPTGEHAEARGRAPARAAGAGDLARRAGEGVRQPLLRRRTGIFGLGGRHLGRHHHHRPDFRLLGRGRGGRRAAQARPRSGRRSSTSS